MWLNPVQPMGSTSLENPIGLSDLPGALKQAYDLRSKHVHVFKELPKLLTAGFHHGETFSVDRVTMLTFQGMTRLARHVITGFIKRQPKVATEVYDYRRERAGIIEVAPAPKYWIGRSEGLVVSSGQDRLEGFLNQYQGGMCISGVLKTAERTTRYLISPLGPNWVGTDIAV